ncbi:DUF6777 domain-containing protein [Actinomycetospora termitidis]|uniref:DUF6777 domain-containing protein n=1 Tax=Actinomycetospora termitidis TaxID=3053470 RepID=A0ABT7MI04_9PSEU|nr:DUF6777 domain-containing protein [Actinomycetospora sp. Odt1-22]MDL5160076.1 hypothetical protein [Actinomycetospora sp. Odt1-22]
MTMHTDPRTVRPSHPQFTGRPQQFAPQQFGPQQPFPQQPPFGGHPAFRPQGFPGQQFQGPVPPPPAAPLPKKRPIAGKIIAGLVAAGLVVGGAGAWYALSDSSASAVQATSFAGADPTTSPFGTDHAEVATVSAEGPQSGDTKGLYATTTPASCDDAAFLQQLQADPAKLAAWGGVYGLAAKDVPAFVESLSPVVLRAATSVTDHPFRDGAFVEQPAVLAPGTAVLVNSYGEPTVKCYNGNPLTAGPATAGAVTVTPTTRVVTNFSFTTVDNSRVVVTPGKPDPKPNKGPNPGAPDPVLSQKAADAQKLADQARKDADAATAKADEAYAKSVAARTEEQKLTALEKSAQGRLGDANTALQIADGERVKAMAAVPVDAGRRAAADQAYLEARIAQSKAQDEAKVAGEAAKKARDDAEEADAQLRNASSAARSAEGVAKAAEEAAKKAKDDADASAKGTEQEKADEKTDPATGEQAQVPATEGTGQEAGQTPDLAGTTGTGQEPAVQRACQDVVTAEAAPICPATGSADQAPATVDTGVTGGGETGTATTSGSESTGSTETGSQSGSQSGSQGTSEGTDN